MIIVQSIFFYFVWENIVFKALNFFFKDKVFYIIKINLNIFRFLLLREIINSNNIAVLSG